MRLGDLIKGIHTFPGQSYVMCYTVYGLTTYIIWDYDDYPDIVISVTRADL